MFSRFIEYLRETRRELAKVNWPTSRQTVRSTLLVVAFSLVVAFLLGFIDVLFQFLLVRFVL